MFLAIGYTTQAGESALAGLDRAGFSTSWLLFRALHVLEGLRRILHYYLFEHYTFWRVFDVYLSRARRIATLQITSRCI